MDPAGSDPFDRLRRALAVLAAHRADASGRSDPELLALHPELRDLLEPMLAEEPAPAATPEHLLAGFRIVGELGRGGMGVVYDAVQISLGRRVALKILPPQLALDPRAVARFRREAHTAGQLDHPGIVKVLEVGTEGDLHWIAMERIEGAPIRRRDVRTVVTQIAAVADALQHAHGAGLVHRDVKPSNILVRTDGSTVLTDFGLARTMAAPSLTCSGEFAGTPFYVSPEQARGERVDHRTDIYSLGATAYELLTGERPFRGETSAAVVQQILDTEPRNPSHVDPGIPRDIAAVVLKALEKDPLRRYQTAAEFANDLRRFLSQRAVLARHATLGQRVLRWVRREPRLAAAVGTILVVLAAALSTTLPLLLQVEGALHEIRRLADVQASEEAIEAEKQLFPALPAKAPAMAAWVSRCDELLGRKLLHEQMLARERSNPNPDDASRWQMRVLETLLTRLEVLARLQPKVAARRADALSVETRTCTGDRARAAWQQAAGLAAADPRYQGLQLRPIPGFLPLGADPVTRLLEFWHVGSGDEPERDPATGRWRIEARTGLVFVLLPGGTFRMGAVRPDATHALGAPNVDPVAIENEAPVHEVTLAPFLLSKYETTQAQWQRHTGTNPSYYKSPAETGGYAADGRNPVEMVSWNHAARVAGELDLVLPTEAQFEYAARAGAASVYFTGNDAKSLQGYVNIADKHVLDRGWKDLAITPEIDDGHWVHARVGTFAPNGFGLFDILGNVGEHVQDWLFAYDQPVRPGDGLRLSDRPAKNRGMRGGSFYFPANAARSSHRWGDRPDAAYNNLGVRFARRVP